MSNKIRSAVVALVVAALCATGTGAAHASAPDPSDASVSSPRVFHPEGPVSSLFLSASEYTYAEVLAAVRNSPYVTVVPARAITPGMSTNGVTFGWYVYVRVSQTQARAILNANAALAVGIIGLATGGVGALVAGAVYAYIVSVGSDALNRCARWQFNVTYTGRVVRAACY